MADQSNSVNTCRTYIGLGSNLGDTIANVNKAVEELSRVGKLLARSSLYLTKPWGYIDQPDFINAVAAIETSYKPCQLLVALKDLEKSMGRQVEPILWGPRIIDLDILTFDNLQLKEEDLIIPHPHMLERAFVLAPLAEIDNSYKKAYLDLPESLRLQVKQL